MKVNKRFSVPPRLPVPRPGVHPPWQLHRVSFLTPRQLCTQHVRRQHLWNMNEGRRSMNMQNAQPAFSLVELTLLMK